MRRISLYHLETLLWISRLGTFAAAAARLNTTQPAISARVRELENQIGYPIFQRAGRTMELTVRGRRLVKECEPLWSAIERTLLPQGRAGEAGIVRIGAGEIAAATCLPAFLAELKETLPQASFEIEIDLSQTMLRKLLGATQDLIFLAGPMASPDLRTERIGQVDMIWVTSPALDPGAGRAPPGDMAIWLVHPHSPIHGQALASLAEAGFAAPPINSCNNVRTLIDIVLTGGGMSFVPEIMVRDDLARGALVELGFAARRPLPFQVAIRARERDPLIEALYQRAIKLDIGS